MMMPKWIGSTPSSIATGRSTGARMRMALEVSMNIPTTSNSRFTTIRNITGERSDASSASLTWPGMRSAVSTKENKMPEATMNITIDDVLAEAIRIEGRFLKVISLYTNRDTTRA